MSDVHVRFSKMLIPWKPKTVDLFHLLLHRCRQGVYLCHLFSKRKNSPLGFANVESQAVLSGPLCRIIDFWPIWTLIFVCNPGDYGDVVLWGKVLPMLRVAVVGVKCENPEHPILRGSSVQHENRGGVTSKCSCLGSVWYMLLSTLSTGEERQSQTSKGVCKWGETLKTLQSKQDFTRHNNCKLK